jgi:uncharacterized protein (DUF302 family)
LTTNAPRYGYLKHLPKRHLADARTQVAAALQAEGFGILTEIDVQATLKKKLNRDTRPYVILGACNPHLADAALQAEIGVGLLLPCNVCLWEEDDGVTVAIARPDVMFEVVGNRALQPMVDDATARLTRALDALA